MKPIAEVSSPRGRLARLKAALAVIEAEDAAAAAEATRQATAAEAEAEQGRQVTGRKPKRPLAALARAEVDHTIARERVERMQAARAAKLEAAERGQKLKAPPPCRIQTAKDTLGRAEAALAAARAAVEAAPAAAGRANVTDPDSRIMKPPTAGCRATTPRRSSTSTKSCSRARSAKTPVMSSSISQ